jgi:peptide/nickel transport system substrate-binding protein
MLSRRGIIAAAAAAMAAPRIAAAEVTRTLKFVPQADLTIVDPSWTAAYVTRNHAMMVFDTLFAADADNAISPQMLAGHVVEDDGNTWRLTLRNGLTFHDGTPVLARDCVASIRRWSLRDNFGKTVAAFTNEMTAPDDKTIQIRLKRPFPLLAAALGKGGSSVCAIMPERLADGDKSKPITEVVGSGPYRFVADERNTGALVVYARFDRYVPRSDGTPSFIAGPKVANFDRVEWHIIPDQATAAAALQAGEVDWWEVPTSDLWPVIEKNSRLTLKVHDRTGYLGFMRFNHLTAPFNNPAIRRAVFGAVNQDEFMEAVVGDNAAMRRGGVGYFCPTSPMASIAGMDALTGPRDTGKVREAVQTAGYAGEKVVVLIPSDFPTLKSIAEVGADMLRRCGFNVDVQYTDWGTMVQRLSRIDASTGGGWNVYHSYWSGLDQWDPAVNASLRGLGRNGGPGWPDSPKIEALRDAWLVAASLDEQKHIAADLQLQAFQDVPYIPLGQMFAPMAYKKEITGVLDGYALFWNVKRG